MTEKEHVQVEFWFRSDRVLTKTNLAQDVAEASRILEKIEKFFEELGVDTRRTKTGGVAVPDMLVDADDASTEYIVLTGSPEGRFGISVPPPRTDTRLRETLRSISETVSEALGENY